MTITKKTVLIISVGGATVGIAFSLQQSPYSYVIFVCSEQTCQSVYDALNKAKLNPQPVYIIIQTEHHENISDNTKTLLDEIPKRLRKWNKDWDDCIIDYTGGSKALSAALVLATIRFAADYQYINSQKRTPDKDGKPGTGVTVTGTEYACLQANPWKALFVIELENVDLLFARARYASAYETLDRILNLVGPAGSIPISILRQLANAYRLWDSFEYRNARSEMKKCVGRLREQYVMYHQSDRYLQEFSQQVHKTSIFLDDLVGEGKGQDLHSRSLIIDLVSNAIRRAECEARFDDATVRLYSALEKMAQATLLEKYGINNSKAKLADIPEELQKAFVNSVNKDPDGNVVFKFGLLLSFELLAYLDADFCRIWGENSDELFCLMDIRNHSMLIHGTTPIREDAYIRMRKLVQAITGIHDDDLVTFPVWNTSQWTSIRSMMT